MEESFKWLISVADHPLLISVEPKRTNGPRAARIEELSVCEMTLKN